MGKNNIDNLLKSYLSNFGFKQKGYDFVKPISDNIIHTIGFGKSVYAVKGHTLINPFIGVGYRDINKLYADLCDVKFCECPTLWQGLGYLMPENDYKEWDFINDGNNDEVLSDMFTNLFHYGEQYWIRLSDFDELFNAVYIREKGLLNDRRERLLPILYYMKGEKEKGIKFIQETIERRSIRPTDEELLAGRDKEKITILRAGEGQKLTADDMKKMLNSLPSGGSIEIVGSGCNGNIDPSYLEFAKRYEQLP